MPRNRTVGICIVGKGTLDYKFGESIWTDRPLRSILTDRHGVGSPCRCRAAEYDFAYPCLFHGFQQLKRRNHIVAVILTGITD